MGIAEPVTLEIEEEEPRENHILMRKKDSNPIAETVGCEIILDENPLSKSISVVKSFFKNLIQIFDQVSKNVKNMFPCRLIFCHRGKIQRGRVFNFS